jgi:hypothetical protein
MTLRRRIGRLELEQPPVRPPREPRVCVDCRAPLEGFREPFGLPNLICPHDRCEDCSLAHARAVFAALNEAGVDWRTARNAPDPEAGFPGMRYVLLHSFSHALMRSLALEAGYAQAAIRERIYAREADAEGGPMAGVLLATAASDSEGTLGGLVALGEREAFAEVLRASLDAAELCASDPYCAEHEPGPHGVHGAACHACLFAPETSCERGNRYLDRAVLAALVSGPDIAYGK